MSLELALSFHRHGLNVMSVPRPDAQHDGKKPAQPWLQWQTVQQTDADVRRLFAGTPSNVAILTGAINDLVVIDVDSPPAMRLAVIKFTYTPWQTKTPRGYHLFYRHPGRGIRVANRARIDTGDGKIAIDVRGDGGFVVAPGSLHASGAHYEFAGDWSKSREQLPRFWPGWLERPRRRPPAAPDRPRPTGDVIERARRYLAATPRPELGKGSDAATLSAACRLVRGFGLSPGDAASLLWEWAGGRPGWTHAWIAAKVQNAERYGTEPIGALR